MNWKPERAWFLLLEVGRFNLYCTHLYGFKGFKPKTTEAHWRRLFILILNSSSKNSMLFRRQPWRRFCNNWYWSFIFEVKISSKRISQLTCLSDFNFWFFFRLSNYLFIVAQSDKMSVLTPFWLWNEKFQWMSSFLKLLCRNLGKTKFREERSSI